MSENKRKIAYYSLTFQNVIKKEVLVGSELATYFNELLSFIINKDFAEKKVIVESSKKFYYMADYTDDKFVNIRFEAAKIGHRPFLVDEETGSKRDNPKKMHEGEAEISHMSLDFKEDEIILALEERMVGVTVKQIVGYFRSFIMEYAAEKRCEIDYFYMEYDDFIEKLRSLKKINVCKVYFSRESQGSEFFNFLPFDRSIRDSAELIIKPQVRQSIKKNFVEKAFEVTGEGSKLSRIRVEGMQDDNAKIKLDSDSFKLIKHIDVKIDEDTGLVDSADIFTKLNQNLEEF